MNEFLNSFSNREISVVFWLLIIVISCVIRQRNDFKQIINIIKMLFNKYFVVIYFIIGIYFYIIINYFIRIGIWEIALYKDFIFWLFTSAFITLFNCNNINKLSDFKSIILKLFSLTLILEFLIGFYNFSLIGELILIPSITIISILYFIADNKREYRKVLNFLNTVLSIIGFLIFVYTLYKIVTAGKNLLSIANLKSFLFEPLFTLLFIPIVYLIVVFMKYEDIFGNLNRSNFINRKRKLKIKWIFILFANVNLKFLDNAKEITIWNKLELNEEKKLVSYLRKRIKNTMIK